MKDDFSALDLLSIDGFRLSPEPLKKKKKGKKAKKAKKKEQRALLLSKPDALKVPTRRRLAALLPLLGRRFIHRDLLRQSLQGWPVSLSWPAPDQAGKTENFPESPWGNF